jgi:hypothetical protein
LSSSARSSLESESPAPSAFWPRCAADLILAALGSDGSHQLERDGLVTRTATPTVPVTVSYELTDLGLSLHQTMRAIKTWAETHMDDVLANREAHDAHAA